MNVLSISSSCQPTAGSSVSVSLLKNSPFPHSHPHAPCKSRLPPWLQSWTHAQLQPNKISPSPDYSDWFRSGQVTMSEPRRQMRQRSRVYKGKCFSVRTASSTTWLLTPNANWTGGIIWKMLKIGQKLVTLELQFHMQIPRRIRDQKMFERSWIL